MKSREVKITLKCVVPGHWNDNYIIVSVQNELESNGWIKDAMVMKVEEVGERQGFT
jgi:hypothetical protein